MLHRVVHTLVLLNGIYDVICFLGIMWFPLLPGFSSFHVNVLREEENRRHPLVRRLLAYWILTYGTVRILAGGVNHESYTLNLAAALTYFIEIFGFEYELHAEKTVIYSKATAITLMSLPLAMALLITQPVRQG